MSDSNTVTNIILQIENIYAAYNKKEVLHGVSLSIQRGTLTVFIGPNGAGKSTLLKVIAGLVMPSQGKIHFAGRDITRFTLSDRISLGMGYCMQDKKAFPSLSVIENLEIGAIRLSTKERKNRTSEVLDMFPSLKTILHRRAGLLSGGERQTLTIATAMIKRPHMLLLDEPSAGLSPRLARDLLKRVNEYSRTWGATVLLVEQNFHEALVTAHYAVAMANGRIALETDKPEEWGISGNIEALFLGRISNDDA